MTCTLIFHRVLSPVAHSLSHLKVSKLAQGMHLAEAHTAMAHAEARWSTPASAATGPMMSEPSSAAIRAGMQTQAMLGQYRELEAYPDTLPIYIKEAAVEKECPAVPSAAAAQTSPHTHLVASLRASTRSQALNQQPFLSSLMQASPKPTMTSQPSRCSPRPPTLRTPAPAQHEQHFL